LLVSAAPGQSPTYKPTPTMQGHWWDGLFGGSEPKPEPVKPDKDASPAPTVADRMREHDRLRNAYMRRVAVCDQLVDIAHITNDEALKAEAQRLEELAFELYQKQSAKVLGVGAGRSLTEDAGADRPAPNSAASLSARARTGGADGSNRREASSREGER
jgi:hypothetical protein